MRMASSETTDGTAAQAEDYIRRSLAHLWIPTQQPNELAEDDALLVIESGEGVMLRDSKGRQYIDALSGLWVVNAGHGRSELAEVARDQMARLGFANAYAYASPPAIDLASKLAAITPSNLTRAFFVSGGSEAVETALRLAKQYHYNRGDQKRFKVISRIGSYHGTTMGAMSVNNASYLNRTPFEPLMPGSIAVPNINCDRCPYEKTFPECDVFCARTIADVIRFHKPETIAAIIAEPISTAHGSWVPDAQYWRTLRALCDEYGIVLIADEVITGFGRTGTWFGMEHFDTPGAGPGTHVQADIMTIAKGLSSGYQPIAAALASEKIAQAFIGEAEDTFIGGVTFGAHPVACAVALANIAIIERENLVENSARMGEHIAGRLQELAAAHPSVSATRGVGLMQVVELQRNPESGEDFRPEDAIGKRMTQALREEGILSRGGASIQIAPPLVINREEADNLVDGVDRAIRRVELELNLG